MSNSAEVLDDPRERLLDAAEILFAEHGFHGVSIRTITSSAKVNLAAAHYYYKSKLELFKAVFARRVAVMNSERMRRLQTAWPDHDKKPSVEAILEAYIAPSLETSMAPGWEHFRKLSGRSTSDPSPEVRETIYGLYDDVAPIFVKALCAARPDLSEQDVLWRLYCIYGTMMYVRADSGRPYQLMDLPHPSLDVGQALKHLIPYLTVLFLSPSISPRE